MENTHLLERSSLKGCRDCSRRFFPLPKERTEGLAPLSPLDQTAEAADTREREAVWMNFPLHAFKVEKKKGEEEKKI